MHKQGNETVKHLNTERRIHAKYEKLDGSFQPNDMNA